MSSRPREGEGLEPESVGTASLCEKGERCVKEECELVYKETGIAVH
jgi:hypothetical protein